MKLAKSADPPVHQQVAVPFGSNEQDLRDVSSFGILRVPAESERTLRPVIAVAFRWADIA